MGSSFIGPLKPDFMEVTMTSPDLYGPFWVATTLIFVTAGAFCRVMWVRVSLRCCCLVVMQSSWNLHQHSPFCHMLHQ